MSTPEVAVKAKVKALLKRHSAYHFMPATHGYGTSGVPDIVACWRGQFMGIECKAGKGKPTALQLKHLRDIRDSLGIAILVDETGIGVLALLIETFSKGVVLRGGFHNMTKHDVVIDYANETD